MAKHKCIYCLQEKDETAFNREHVVPRMMGTYQNGYVLSNYEVILILVENLKIKLA